MRSTRKYLLVGLLAAFVFSFAHQAQAFESPLDKLVSKYKELVSRDKKTIIENRKEGDRSEGDKVELRDELDSSFEKLIEEQKRNPDRSKWDWDEVEDAVEFASEKTGVRKEFLFGMLTVESDLGRNTGECSYEEVEEGARDLYQKGLLGSQAWRTFQHRRSLIKGIAEGLGYDYRQLRVSCNPAQYTGTGGALGVPQFMPDTWLEYKDRISAAVGKKNPDPWNIKDGVVAMAIKLADCPGVVNHNKIAENNAAKLYLSGTTSWQYNWYANLVQYWSQNYHYLLA